MKQKKIAIIGAGISGLSAGIHAALKGFEVDIYESHNIVGGQCTTWYRKGYNIDGCIHWLSGSKPGTPLHRVWELCGALSNEVSIVNHEHITSYRDNDGHIYHLYKNMKRMEDELLRISLEDKKEIKDLIRFIKAFQRMPMPTEKPVEMMNILDGLKFAWPMLTIGKRMKFGMQTTIPDYINRFKSPVIRHLLSAVVPPVSSVSSMFFTLACATNGDGGWPMGGFLQFAQRMQQRFETLGGKIFFKSPVNKIVIENKQAVGIQLQGEDSIRRYDYVVPAADMYETLFRLLDGNYDVPFFQKRYADPVKYPILSATLVSIGVNMDLSGHPHTLFFQPNQKIVVGGEEYPFIIADHYCYDPAFSREGRSLVEFLFSGFSYDYWKNLRESSEEAYENEKQKLGEILLSELSRIYPETEGKSQVIDVATPLTSQRYCNAYKGAYMSFLSTVGAKYEDHNGIISDVDNLYLAGQWEFANGGLPGAVLAGKFAVQRICKKEKVKIAF